MFYAPTEANVAIINALRATKGVYVDDHRKNKETDSATHFAVLEVDGVQHVCPLPNAKHYGAWISSLNPIYLKDGQVHLSTCSAHTLNQNGATIGEAINAFNEQFKDCKWGKAEIVDVVII